MNLFVKHASQKGLIIVLSALWQIPSSTDVKFRNPGEVLSRSGRIVFSKVYKDPPAMAINQLKARFPNRHSFTVLHPVNKTDRLTVHGCDYPLAQLLVENEMFPDPKDALHVRPSGEETPLHTLTTVCEILLESICRMIRSMTDDHLWAIFNGVLKAWVLAGFGPDDTLAAKATWTAEEKIVVNKMLSEPISQFRALCSDTQDHENCRKKLKRVLQRFAAKEADLHLNPREHLSSEMLSRDGEKAPWVKQREITDFPTKEQLLCVSVVKETPQLERYIRLLPNIIPRHFNDWNQIYGYSDFWSHAEPRGAVDPHGYSCR